MTPLHSSIAARHTRPGLLPGPECPPLCQYGLVAEEVEKLCPELATHAVDGQVQSVR